MKKEKDKLEDLLVEILADIFEKNATKEKLEKYLSAVKDYEIAGGMEGKSFRLIGKFYEMICFNYNKIREYRKGISCEDDCEDEFYRRFKIIGREDE